MTTAQERKKMERAARRRRIQRAARSVFTEKGYARTSIEQIARQASLSVGAIYLYFRSKEDLYVSLLEESLSDLTNELSTLAASVEGHDGTRLHAGWNALVGWATRDVEATRQLRLVAQPGIRKQLSDEVTETTQDSLASIETALGNLIRHGVDAGDYRPETNAATTARLLWTLFAGVLQQQDVRTNLEIDGASFEANAQTAFTALEASIAGRARFTAAA